MPKSDATSSSKMSLSEAPSKRAQINLLLLFILFVSLTGTNDRAMLSLPSTRSAKIAASHLAVWLVTVVGCAGADSEWVGAVVVAVIPGVAVGVF